MDFALVATGLVVGILIGLTSMGGASLMTPFLILFLGVRPVVAVGTDLAYSAFTKIVGAVIHWRQGTADVRVACHLASGSVPGALLGVLAVALLHRYGLNPDAYIRRAIGVTLVLVSLLLILRTLGGLPFRIPYAWLSRWREPLSRLWAAGIGFAVGLTSVGSGSLVAPLLMALYPLTPARVVGTDIFHAAILVSVTAAGHSRIGTVDWPLTAGLLVGSVPGVLLGSYMAPRLPARPLRMGLACLLLASGLKIAVPI